MQGNLRDNIYSCIYCFENKGEEQFNKDHVIPECFGTFEPNSFILINTVCASCNQFFGDHIELYMGRDSLEGVSRYNYEIFPDGKPIFKRLVFRIEKPGSLYGMLVSPKPKILEGLPEIELIDQVGFFNIKTSKYEYFPDTNIPKIEYLEKAGYDFMDKGIKIVGNLDKLRQLLAGLGYPNSLLKEETLFNSPDDKKHIPVAIEARIDRTIARGIAKIAFNYLTYISNRGFVLSSNFDTIRRFIRNDEGNFDDIFRIEKRPILKKEREINKRILDGHIIVIDWHGDDLICSLSPFNRLVQLTYIIRLSERYVGLWIPIFRAHYFDVTRNKIMILRNIHIN